MDIFSEFFSRSHPFLRQAVLEAAWQLGLFEILRSPCTADELATRAAADAGKLRALVEVLVLEGFVQREAGLLRATDPPPERPAPEQQLAVAGWGRLAEVLRHGRPLVEPDPEARRAQLVAYHRHLLSVGAGPARELATRWGGGARRILDAGGGAGGYTAALLAVAPQARATLVDLPEVLPLAATRLAADIGRVTLQAGDLRTLDLPAEHDLVLLVHVLHLHGAADAAAIVSRAAAALAPGGRLLIRDLRLAADGSGPLAARYFALNMALYTAAGEVWPVAQLEGWLRAAGLCVAEATTLACAPESVVLVGRPSND